MLMSSDQLHCSNGPWEMKLPTHWDIPLDGVPGRKSFVTRLAKQVSVDSRFHLLYVSVIEAEMPSGGLVLYCDVHRAVGHW